MATINGMWIGAELSALERACLQSFVSRGHHFRLFHYEDITAPAGVELVDARTILPASSIFTYRRGPGRGSPAAFSNMFRYKLLEEIGGWWVDLDVFCLSGTLPEDGPVLAEEEPGSINCAVMNFPRGHETMRVAYEECVRRQDDVDWGETGPRLITRLVAEHRLAACVFPRQVFYPIHCSHYWVLFDPRRTADAGKKIEGAACLHLWNDMIRRAGLDKNVLPPPGSLMRNLYEWTLDTSLFEREYHLQPCEDDKLVLAVSGRREAG